MKVTEQAIREAMKLGGGVAVTLGTLEEPTRTRIAVVGSGLYLVAQQGYSVTMTLQFAAHNPAILGYPTEVKFDLADISKLEMMQAGISAYVSQLQREGKHEDAAKVAAILTLPCEDIERVYDALVAGLTKAQFIDSLSVEAVAVPAAKAPSGERVRLGSPSAKHLYNVGVNIGGGTSYIEVEANDRGQASRIATKAGYEVRDVNMVG